MRLPKILLAALSLFLAAPGSAQVEKVIHSDNIFARLSYDESAVRLQQKEPPANGLPQDFLPDINPPHMCIAIAQDGSYRVAMILDGKFQHLQGKIKQEQFQQLRNLLSSPDFRSLSGSHSAMLLQRAETFGAEVVQPNAVGTVRSQRLQWLNPDGENPFPPSVSKVIDWLKKFKPIGASEFVYSEFSNVCPTFGLRLLQPAVASNNQ